MPFLNRPSFLALLDRLDDADDSAVVAAAREIQRRLREAGVTWGDLLVPEDAPAPMDADGGGDAGAAVEPGKLDQPADAAGEDLAIIARLLDRSELSETTREELEGMRADIAGGEFTARDRRYLRDLEARLAKPA